MHITVACTLSPVLTATIRRLITHINDRVEFVDQALKLILLATRLRKKFDSLPDFNQVCEILNLDTRQKSDYRGYWLRAQSAPHIIISTSSNSVRHGLIKTKP